MQSLADSATASFYSKPYLSGPFNFPLQWASHPVLGQTRFQSSEKLISWTDISLDPRRDRETTGKAVFEAQGRVRSLVWPSEAAPVGRLTISGWRELVIGFAPQRIDLDLQEEERSVSLAWELVDDSPPPRPGSEFSFEGLLALSGGGSQALPVADCRVVIESCPVLIFQPERGSLVNQLGTAGHKSLKDKQSSPALLIVLMMGALIILFAAAKKLMSRKAKDQVPPAPT